ncbi:MFS transporter [Arthrobacter bambusae]|uniref:MFS transporter n=1 Tax=Arthrobacter bambusae TaxID=1338426 RepID=UPI0027889FA7|nr:MFS transporter [Arthrobacter bambusae]MDQ0242145.1 MFS family permease [Arthrobacter bambusae]
MTTQSSPAATQVISPSEPASGRKTPNKWKNLAAITGVEVVDNTEAGAINTIFPAIAAAMKLDSSHLGLLSALGKIVSVPFGPAWVWVGDRYGRKAALIATTVTGGLFGIGSAFSQDFIQLLILNTLMSAALIGGAPITNAIIADSFGDSQRGKATGYYYGILTAVSSFIGPVLALFTGSPDGWRWGMAALGGLCIFAAFIITWLYTDPGVGTSEKQFAGLPEQALLKSKATFKSVMSLFRIPSFSIMMLSRLLSGHLLIAIFGIQFLVHERGFTNAVAAVVLIPFGVAYVIGTFSSGIAVSWLDKIMPHTGRVLFIQLAQIGFATAAFFGTQFVLGDITAYTVFWALMGFTQGMNPPVNRPIVMSTVLPELRGQAFAIFLTVFQTIGWAMFALSAGWLAKSFGIEGVFLWVLVGLMIVNAIVLAALYWTYPRDARRVTDELERRRNVALASNN